MKLYEMKIHESGIITTIDRECSVKRRLYDMGFSSGVPVSCLNFALLGSPILYRVGDSMIALRKTDAAKVGVML